MISLAVTAIAAAFLIGLYALYQFLLPKPIPGIPYNAQSANRLLGDIPNLISEVSKGGDFVEWLADQHIKSNSAIRQIFLRPFGRPMILLADYRECRELMVFRTKDFDRSQDVSSMLRPVVRTNQFAQPTGSDWKLHRRLVQDTMSPAFLQDVAAPSIYESCLRFIDLWNIKADLANGRPFAALDDFFYATFDAVGAFTFGSAFPYSATKPQADGLAQLAADDFVLDDIDKPIDFPQFDIDENITSMIRLVDGIERAQSSPSPALAWLMTKASSSFRRARRIKDECIRREIEKAVASAKKNEASEDEAWVRNAVDHIIDRENKLAERENRKPDYFSQIITDEIYGFILAGHDTTSTTMCWSSKLLAENPGWQGRLRKALHAAFPTAKTENRCPTAREIMETSIPCLDATIEETLRYRPTAPLGTRDAIRDTTILGHPVPKGTTVIWLVNSSNFLKPAMEVDESRRSQRCQEEKKQQSGRVGEWEDNDIGLFKPERWLTTDKEGSTVFDGNAGPSSPFGMGLRSCFGRRLAHVEMKIILAMLFWSFELLECPAELSGHSGHLALTYKPAQCYVRLKKVDHANV